MMKGEGKLPDIADSELLGLESDALWERAQDPGVTETERQHLIAESDRVLLNLPFVTIRENLLATRPGFELPYPEDSETFREYYERVSALADQYDLSKGE